MEGGCLAKADSMERTEVEQALGITETMGEAQEKRLKGTLGKQGERIYRTA